MTNAEAKAESLEVLFSGKVGLYDLNCLKGKQILGVEIKGVKTRMDADHIYYSPADRNPDLWTVYVRYVVDEKFKPTRAVADCDNYKTAKAFAKMLRQLLKHK